MSETVSQSVAPAEPQHAVQSDDSVDVPTQVASTEKSTGLRRSDQVVAIVIAVIVLVLMIARWLQLSGWGMHSVEIDQLPRVGNRFTLDINTATPLDWAQLEGVGEVTAQRIVDDRITNGDFESVDDLLRVEGIGPKTLEQIRPWLTTNQSKPTD